MRVAVCLCMRVGLRVPRRRACVSQIDKHDATDSPQKVQQKFVLHIRKQRRVLRVLIQEHFAATVSQNTSCARALLCRRRRRHRPRWWWWQCSCLCVWALHNADLTWTLRPASCTHADTVAQTSHLLRVVRCGPHRSSLSNSTFSRTSCMHRRMCPDSRTTLAAVQLLYRTTERRSKQRPLLSRRCLVNGSQLLYSAYAVLLIRSREYC